MLYLMEYKGDKKIVPRYNVEHLIKSGWTLIKPLPDCPNSVKYISFAKRSPREIIEWYDFKITNARNRLIDLQKQSRKFKELVGDDV